MISILCIHDIVSGRPDSPWEIDVVEFENLLSSLIQRGYHFCGLDKISDKTERAIVLTFDDAPGGAVNWVNERGHIFNIQATIFPVVDWLDLPPPRSADHSYRSLASWQDIKLASKKGHIIGSHGMSHLPMHTLEEREIIYELIESKKRLEDQLGSIINHFAAPFGKLSPLVTDIAFKSGYTSVCSTIAGNNSIINISGSILKRFVVRSDFPKLGLPDDLMNK